MKFTALKVMEGDSFLLEAFDQVILVDTGRNENECRDQLIELGITRIDLLLITHYDSDHIGGLINLIESSIKLKEIFLPDNFGRISKSLNSETLKLLRFIMESELMNENTKEENIKNQVFILGIDRGYPKGIIELFYTKSILNKRHIELIKKIVDVCNQKEIKITWLKYSGDHRDGFIANNLIGLNCIIVNNINSYIDDLETLYFLSRINHESLVFKYSILGSPNILFTGDTGFEFISDGDKINLTKMSVVTAPHHGSKTIENERGYDLIKGESLVYVRSKNNKVIVSEKFKDLPLKYCIKCNNYKESSVVLTFSGQWTSTKYLCKCL